MFKARDPEDAIARALEARGRSALDRFPKSLAVLPRTDVPLLPFGLVGIDALRAVLDEELAPTLAAARQIVVSGNGHDLPPLSSLVPDLAHTGYGVVMAMGKGGVGKTSIASAIAVEIAMRGHRVHLTTTDPAAHVDASLASRVTGLKVGRIDPVRRVDIL